MTVRLSDLPEFSSILDAHQYVQHSSSPQEQEEDAAEAMGPFARDYIEGLPTRFAGDASEAFYVAPLADVVKRISALTGIEVPEIDEAETAFSSVVMAGGIDDDG